MKARHLEPFMNELITCTLCGYCKNVCPTFLGTGWDSGSARGRNLLAYGMLTGEIEPDPSVAERLYQCTLCLDCERRCPSKVKVPEIVEAARADLVDAGLATEPQEMLVKTVEDTKNIYGDTEERVPLRKGDVTLFLGCQYLERPNDVKRILRVFDKLGISATITDEMCCGVPYRNLGFADQFEEYKKRFMEWLPDKNVVTFCPTCTLFLKEEYDLPVRHALELVVEKLDGADVKPLNMEVTYHDPCHLGRGYKLTDEPRDVLSSIGVTVKEMSFNRSTTRCCGGGGTMLVSDAPLASEVAKKRIDQAKQTGVDTLVTACANCVATLKKASSAVGDEGGKAIAVRDIWHLLNQAIS